MVLEINQVLPLTLTSEDYGYWKCLELIQQKYGLIGMQGG